MRSCLLLSLSLLLSACGGAAHTPTSASPHAPARSMPSIASDGDDDADGDGIGNPSDQCPGDPEDFDAYQDEDGCPDPDNDQDGLLDVDDLCPNDAETRNGFEDEDGCPDHAPQR